MESTELKATVSTPEIHPQDSREDDPLTPAEPTPSCGAKLRRAWDKFKRFCDTFSSLLSAFVTRVIFAVHFLMAYWIVIIQVKWRFGFWFLPLGMFGLLIESIVTFYIRKGADYKWVCPSVFFYLASIVPCVWVLELDMLDDRLKTLNKEQGQLKGELDLIRNETEELEYQQGAGAAGGAGGAGFNLTILENLKVPIDLEPGQWVVMIEQLVLFVLILGRWMLPKGDISRDELSQLLLVYIGMAADIIEFFEAFKEDKVRFNWDLIIIILAIWSASLLQFCLVLTATKSKKGRAGFQHKLKENGEPEVVTFSDSEEADDSECCECCACCGTEVFGIMTTVVLQDGPFLALRLVLLFKYEVTTYMHIFFTVKNSLVLLLMMYRLYVVYENKSKSPSRENSVKSDYINIDNDGRSTDQEQ